MTQVGMMLIEEGRQKGRREGRQEGRQEGRREGRQEGRREEATKMAVNLLKSGKFSLQEIKTYVPMLSLSEIETLASQTDHA